MASTTPIFSMFGGGSPTTKNANVNISNSTAKTMYNSTMVMGGGEEATLRRPIQTAGDKYRRVQQQQYNKQYKHKETDYKEQQGTTPTSTLGKEEPRRVQSPTYPSFAPLQHGWCTDHALSVMSFIGSVRCHYILLGMPLLRQCLPMLLDTMSDSIQLFGFLLRLGIAIDRLIGRYVPYVYVILLAINLGSLLVPRAVRAALKYARAVVRIAKRVVADAHLDGHIEGQSNPSIRKACCKPGCKADAAMYQVCLHWRDTREVSTLRVGTTTKELVVPTNVHLCARHRDFMYLHDYTIQKVACNDEDDDRMTEFSFM
jgi:hypothetical protein